MLRIAICDDDPSQLQKSERLLKDYMDDRALAGRLFLFESGMALLNGAEEYNGFDLILLDILMPELDGIQTALSLRKLDHESEIIYLTSSNDYAADSYNARAFFYLLKPVDREKLFSVLDAAMAKLRRRQTESIVVSTHEGSRRILLDEIMFAERLDRRVCYHCIKENVVTQTLRNPFRDAVAELLNDPRFYLCGVSYVLNLQHIIEITGQTVLFDTGARVSPPRNTVLPLKAAWGKYWLEGECK